MSGNDERFSLDCAPDAVIAAEASGRLIYANPSARRLFGLEAGDPAALSITDLLPAWGGNAAVRAPLPPFGATTGRRRDGTLFGAEVAVGRTAAGPDDEPAVVISVRACAATPADAAPGATEAILQQQREFFSLFNHDVRQSLQAIQFLSETLAISAPETVSVITEILGSVRRLLDTLLRFNDTGSALPAVESCSLGELMQKLRRELAPVAERKGLDLVVEDTPERLCTDPVLLRELLQNLVANAIRYTHQGEVRVSCRATAAALHVDIVDTGVGISEEQLRRAFVVPAPARGEPRSDGGFGLGLAIVRRLADALGCRVAASSTPGRGSTFTVTVPRTGSRFEALRVEPQPAAGDADSVG